MSAIKEVIREAATAITLGAFIEAGLIAVFLAGVFVAFALSVAP